jgi:hypothetical protein
MAKEYPDQLAGPLVKLMAEDLDAEPYLYLKNEKSSVKTSREAKK